MKAPSDEATLAGAQLCNDIEGWCPALPGNVDALTPGKSRRCAKAESYARAMHAFAAAAVARERERCRRIASDHARAHAAACETACEHAYDSQLLRVVGDVARDACNAVALAIESTKV